MKSEEEIIAEYKKIKHDVDVYHTAKCVPIDRHGNEIGGYDNVFNEGMLEALRFVLDK